MKFTCPTCKHESDVPLSALLDWLHKAPCGHEWRVCEDGKDGLRTDRELLVPTFRDLVSGKTAKAQHAASLFWWSEGNGGCDCNRESAFPFDEGHEGDDENDGSGGARFCVGSQRYVVIDVEGDIAEHEKAEAIAEMNEGYASPDQLRETAPEAGRGIAEKHAQDMARSTAIHESLRESIREVLKRFEVTS